MRYSEAKATLTNAGFVPDTNYGCGYERGDQWANIHGDGKTRKDCAVTIAKKQAGPGRANPIRHYEDVGELVKAVAT